MRRDRRTPLLLVAVLGLCAAPSWAAKPRPARARASFPTFQVGADGRTILSFRLSQAVEIEEVQRKGHYVIRMKNTRVGVRNDTHALSAEHFDSSVVTARLRPMAHDVIFDVTLRDGQVPPPVRTVRQVTAEERAEEPHKEASSAEVVVTLEFARADSTAK